MAGKVQKWSMTIYSGLVFPGLGQWVLGRSRLVKVRGIIFVALSTMMTLYFIYDTMRALARFFRTGKLESALDFVPVLYPPLITFTIGVGVIWLIALIDAIRLDSLAAVHDESKLET